MINMESLDRRFQELFRLFETAELVAMREHPVSAEVWDSWGDLWSSA